MTSATDVKHVDVLIIGAGLSGIGAARHLQRELPKKSFLILEQRGAIGGTWDLFRYPGVRSDSDMYTLGYNFKPWVSDDSIADGPSILSYVREAASETGVDQHIRYNSKVVGANFASDEGIWTVKVKDSESGEISEITTDFIYSNTGYYRYEEGYQPEFPGKEDFTGEWVHPQFWPEDLDYANKKVVIIGSGATAVTILPAMTDKAAHVTMLQRTPTYMITLPGKDPIANWLRRKLGDKRSYTITRWKNATQTLATFHLSRRWPKPMRKVFMWGVKKQLPEGYDVDTHFNPPYNPWDQRLCAIPDGDLFKAIRRNDASIVTDHIDHIEPNGIKLKSGRLLEADIIIQATGLDLVALGGIDFSVDGAAFDMSTAFAYRGMMLSDLPNLAFTVGYTNASWTLKADLVADFVCKTLKHMDATGQNVVVPVQDDPNVEPRPLLDFPAGYVLRKIDEFPNNGSEMPWKMRMTYHQDYRDFKKADPNDGILRFSRATPTPAIAEPAAA